MEVMNVSGDTQANVLNIVAGILHLGNISFNEDGNYAIPEDDGCRRILICTCIFSLCIDYRAAYVYISSSTRKMIIVLGEPSLVAVGKLLHRL